MQTTKKKYFKKRRKICFFTQNKFTKIDFKNIDLLQKFVTNGGKILPSRATGTSAKWQRRLSIAIKRARHMALIPFVSK
ncbi:30S ribosomal protein S18 [Candidatus Phytoplasma melaleucae]|uniref:Small ribosomal subunit protein bS18 n=1 Tax=Candidatus Phytoplasma melaleucae TaxID=2982630 RepID=A0ABT9DEK2_9MOLU|nr:30S ribosomal protein S18 ['Melaleuca sp.' phytoplasma]MDO8167991.1 30S ribosomal protein S18 ['Melaleuca sp.' phytoplasma]MDV3205375.1 30S ribosomal protein S18 [Weeping tea tree witches'-broom phytoplasma]